MSALQKALEKLNGSLYNLETSVSGLENSMVGQQRDMFGAPIARESSANENIKLDPSIIAKRLDIAIDKVEKVLSDAASA